MPMVFALPVKLADRVRTLNALVNSRGEYKFVAAPEIAAQLFVAHFKSGGSATDTTS